MIKDKTMRALIDGALDLLYPQSLYCICCGKIIDGSRPYRLCNECMDGINWAIGRTCAKCGKPLSDIDPNDVCFSCKEQNHVFRRGYTCAGYGACERAMIFSLKYGDHTDIAGTIGEMLDDRMRMLLAAGETDLRYDIVIPVPMYEPKRLRRGFNQADLIARAFCRKSGLRYEPGLVVRARDTHAMKGLSQNERGHNISGAFELTDGAREMLPGKTVLCVDDIYTTGSTADELSKVLLDAGASAVDYLSFAAGADMINAS